MDGNGLDARILTESEAWKVRAAREKFLNNTARSALATAAALFLFLSIITFQANRYSFTDLLFYFACTIALYCISVAILNFASFCLAQKKHSEIGSAEDARAFKAIVGNFFFSSKRNNMVSRLFWLIPRLFWLGEAYYKNKIYSFDVYMFSVFLVLIVFFVFHYSSVEEVYGILMTGAISFLFLFSMFLSVVAFFTFYHNILHSSRNFWWTRSTLKQKINSRWTSVIEISSITQEGNPFYYSSSMSEQNIHPAQQFRICYYAFMIVSILSFIYYIIFLFFTCNALPDSDSASGSSVISTLAEWFSSGPIPKFFGFAESEPFCSFFTLDQLSPTWFLVVLTTGGLVAAFFEFRSKVRAENRVVWVSKLRENLAQIIAIIQEEDIRKKDALTYFLDTKSLSDPPFNYQTPVEIKKNQIAMRANLELLLNPNERDHQFLSFLIRICSSLDIATAEDRDVIFGIEKEDPLIGIMSRRGFSQSKDLVEKSGGNLTPDELSRYINILNESRHFFFVLRVFKYYRSGTLMDMHFDGKHDISAHCTEPTGVDDSGTSSAAAASEEAGKERDHEKSDIMRDELFEDWGKIVMELYRDNDSGIARLLDSSEYPIIDDPRFRAMVVSIIMRVAHALLKREWERVKNAH